MNESARRWYDPELLRTFLAVAQSLSFTQAAANLGLRQPTVSQHIRKLEDSVGRPLFVRDTRSVALTADGEALADFARTILAAHEQAVGYFTGSGLAGRLRLGVTDDIALTQVPRILRDFRQLYPRIDLELTVAQSATLQRRIESGHLDLAFVKNPAGPLDPRGRLVRRDRLLWASIAGTRVEDERPVPLVVYQAPSASRSLAVEALERVGRSYRITCTVRGVNGVLAAVRAGLGIAVVARSLFPGDFVELPASAGLPELGQMDLVLLRSSRKASEPVEALTAAILSSGNPIKV
ncbi:LysR substrate-binding domain-containing protein [Jatrophihabitans telluris]|uniref:LysR substrate-binding domain-containing protein n=1 Tax=Jatrophihabitans telluris TaxID=2038343 RepID=A0ABY4QWM3_9ACTN|nr:LysR substrate-binding domain-containing protein [Jatrophihabitans telluris]UQX88024.1 LysR substrate-binding domain-containing protein [Jatrophihabitans telluris]